MTFTRSCDFSPADACHSHTDHFPLGLLTQAVFTASDVLFCWPYLAGQSLLVIPESSAWGHLFQKAFLDWVPGLWLPSWAYLCPGRFCTRWSLPFTPLFPHKAGVPIHHCVSQHPARSQARRRSTEPEDKGGAHSLYHVNSVFSLPFLCYTSSQAPHDRD